VCSGRLVRHDAAQHREHNCHGCEQIVLPRALRRDVQEGRDAEEGDEPPRTPSVPPSHPARGTPPQMAIAASQTQPPPRSRHAALSSDVRPTRPTRHRRGEHRPPERPRRPPGRRSRWSPPALLVSSLRPACRSPAGSPARAREGIEEGRSSGPGNYAGVRWLWRWNVQPLVRTGSGTHGPMIQTRHLSSGDVPELKCHAGGVSVLFGLRVRVAADSIPDRRPWADFPVLCRRRFPETVERDLIGAWQLPGVRPVRSPVAPNGRRRSQ
jgi:hypothetical protein